MAIKIGVVNIKALYVSSIILIIVTTAASACISQNNDISSLSDKQKSEAIHILVNNNYNVSDIGEPELFGIGHRSYNSSQTLALVPIIQKSSPNNDVYLVDIDRNTTIGLFEFSDDFSYEQEKALINITVDAPIVNDTFWNSSLIFITANYSSVMNTTPDYLNWTGRFVNVDISTDDPDHQRMDMHKMQVTIDDSVPRVIAVSDWFSGEFYHYSPEYAIIPPGKEKLFDIPEYLVHPNATSLWWTRVIIEPRDSRVLPLIFAESTYYTLINDTPENALVYTDYMTNEQTRYNLSRPMSSGWAANISLKHDAYVHLLLKNPGTNDVAVYVDIIPDRREMDNISARFGM